MKRSRGAKPENKFAIKKKPKVVKAKKPTVIPSTNDSISVFIMKNTTFEQLIKICIHGCSRVMKTKKIGESIPFSEDFTLKKTKDRFVLISNDGGNKVVISKEGKIGWTYPKPPKGGMKNKTMACKFFYICLQNYIESNKIDFSKSKFVLKGKKYNVF